MFIALLHVEIIIPLSRSLKYKRHILKPLKLKIRDSFNASVIESDYKDKWQRALLSIAFLRESRGILDSVVEKALIPLSFGPDLLEKSPETYAALGTPSAP